MYGGMSALSQKQTFAVQNCRSGLLLKADIHELTAGSTKLATAAAAIGLRAGQQEDETITPLHLNPTGDRCRVVPSLNCNGRRPGPAVFSGPTSGANGPTIKVIARPCDQPACGASCEAPGLCKMTRARGQRDARLVTDCGGVSFLNDQYCPRLIVLSVRQPVLDCLGQAAP
jgi:hypothetical protein